MLSALLLIPGALAQYVQGSHHALPGLAPENQALLDLPDTPISDTLATFGYAFEQNAEIAAQIKRMVTLPYFSTYKVDLSDHRCPLEDDTATCANRQCAIEPLTTEDIDANLFESQYLGRLRKDSVSAEDPRAIDEGAASDTVSLYAQPRDYCYPEDESLEAEGVYVDLRDNAERFTGYEGPHASLMWSKVYGENCFGYYGEHPPASRLGDLFGDANTGNEELLPAEECVEQRLFYKLLSGMHASISTHLANDYLNATTKEWGPSLGEWLERVGWHADRLDNMFFDYVLVSRALAKLATVYERQLLFAPSSAYVDAEVRVALRRLGRLLRQSPLADALDEQALFLPGGSAHGLKNEFRQRVRNVNALMSCVGCERCRLWGKIQTAGYGTALKILLELPSDPQQDPDAVAEVLGGFRRSELVALVNTFARISHSVAATANFREQVEDILVDKNSLRYQWNIAMKETWVALKYIGRSYIDLPQNLWILANYHGRRAWDRLIGTVAEPVALHYEL